ncbi:MAG: NAD(P)H-dependent oxidoreductase subunit E [Holophagales bacterium]|nr:NAD(P)H-dependent oxidoreductase subunit E [Holophagales bacterium]
MQVQITSPSSPPVTACKCGEATEEEKLARIGEVVEAFRDKPGSLIQILHLAQGIYGYLPIHVQRLIAEKLDIPVSEVWGVTTFYSFFSTKPRGEYSIRVCMGTACYVRGGMEIVKRLSQTLGVGVGETTADGKFTLEVMRCIGACGLAPALLVNDRVVRQVNPDKLNRVLALCG